MTARSDGATADLEAGYCSMAADEEREREAPEWVEALVADESS